MDFAAKTRFAVIVCYAIKCSERRLVSPATSRKVFENASREQFVHYLFIARGSAGELRTQLMLANRVHELEVSELVRRCERLSKQIWSLIQYLKTTEYIGDRARPGKPREDSYKKWLARHGFELQSDSQVRRKGSPDRDEPET